MASFIERNSVRRSGRCGTGMDLATGVAEVQFTAASEGGSRARRLLQVRREQVGEQVRPAASRRQEQVLRRASRRRASPAAASRQRRASPAAAASRPAGPVEVVRRPHHGGALVGEQERRRVVQQVGRIVVQVVRASRRGSKSRRVKSGGVEVRRSQVGRQRSPAAASVRQQVGSKSGGSRLTTPRGRSEAPSRGSGKGPRPSAGGEDRPLVRGQSVESAHLRKPFFRPDPACPTEDTCRVKPRVGTQQCRSMWHAVENRGFRLEFRYSFA